MPSSDRTPTALIVTFALTWVATATFHAAQSGEPVGVHYDTANRLFTLALVALVALLSAYRSRLADAAPRRSANLEGLAVPLILVNIAFTGLLATLMTRQAGRISALDHGSMPASTDSTHGLDTKIDARFDALAGMDGLNDRIDTVLVEVSGVSERVARLEARR